MILSIRVITDDIDAMVGFYERLTGLTANRPVPFFAEIQVGGALLAFASPATVATLDERRPHPRGNEGLLIELMVDDADAEYERLRGHLDDVVLEPQTMPWGNRSAVFRDPDGNTVNLFSRPAN